MSEYSLSRPPLDDPWRRLVWIVPAALGLWVLMLSGFAILLGERSAMPQPAAIEAQIIDVPPPPPPPAAVGLQPNPAKSAAPIHHEAPHHVKIAPAHPTIATPKVALPSAPAATRAGSTSAHGEANPPEGAGVGSKSAPSEDEAEGGGGAAGTDSSGARAIFSPTPEIPDDLREDALEAEAIARFTISADGTVKVALLKQTSSPRINELLLDTLAKWQFFPAVRGGEPIDSTVDIRIPISVH